MYHIFRAVPNNHLNRYNIGLDQELKKRAIHGELNSEDNTFDGLLNHPNVLYIIELLIKNQHHALVNKLFESMDALGSNSRAHYILTDDYVRNAFNCWLVQFSDNREDILSNLFKKNFFKDHMSTAPDEQAYWSQIAQDANVEFEYSNRAAPSL